MRIILAIDIIEGKCVRLTKGDYGTKKIYSEDPLEIALEAEGNGIKFLHLVDLDGAKQRKPENITVLEKIAEGTNLQIDFGGGIRTDEDINTAFNSGASQVTAGSVAVSDPDLFLKWLSDFGRDKLILGADFKNRKIATSGWLENSENDIITFLTEYVRKGVRYSICTDIERDGMLTGPATEIYNEILGSMDISLIASGGIASVSDIEKVKEAGCEGVIIGKAFYEGKISLNELGRLC